MSGAPLGSRDPLRLDLRRRLTRIRESCSSASLAFCRPAAISSASTHPAGLSFCTSVIIASRRSGSDTRSGRRSHRSPCQWARNRICSSGVSPSITLGTTRRGVCGGGSGRRGGGGGVPPSPGAGRRRGRRASGAASISCFLRDERVPVERRRLDFATRFRDGRRAQTGLARREHRQATGTRTGRANPCASRPGPSESDRWSRSRVCRGLRAEKARGATYAWSQRAGPVSSPPPEPAASPGPRREEPSFEPAAPAGVPA